MTTLSSQPDNFPCVSCGYSLAGLDPATLCPECGFPIADSLRVHRAALIEIADPVAARRHLRVLGMCQVVQCLAYIAIAVCLAVADPQVKIGAAAISLSAVPFIATRLAWWRLAGACRGIGSDRIVQSLQRLSVLSASFLTLLAVAVILASGGPSVRHDLMLMVPAILWLFVFPFEAGAEHTFFDRLCSTADMKPAADWNRRATIVWVCGTIGLVVCGLGALLLPFSSLAAAAASFSAATRLRIWA